MESCADVWLKCFESVTDEEDFLSYSILDVWVVDEGRKKPGGFL